METLVTKLQHLELRERLAHEAFMNAHAGTPLAPLYKAQQQARKELLEYKGQLI